MELVVVAHDGTAAPPPVPYRRVFRGLFALTALFLAIMCSMGQAAGSEKRLCQLIRAVAPGKYVHYSILGYVGAVTLVTVVMFPAAGIVGAIFPGVWGAADFLPGFVYIMAVAAVAEASARVLSEEIYFPVHLVGFVCTAVMGGVFFDIGEAVEAMGFLRYLFLSHYFMSN